MKKYLKVLVVAVIAVMLLGSFAFATNPFAGHDSTGKGSNIESAVEELGGTAINVVQTIGYIIAVVMVLVVGVQWVMATPAKKQELKGRMWNIVIGAALIVGAVTFLGVINTTVINLNL